MQNNQYSNQNSGRFVNPLQRASYNEKQSMNA